MSQTYSAREIILRGEKLKTAVEVWKSVLSSSLDRLYLADPATDDIEALTVESQQIRTNIREAERQLCDFYGSTFLSTEPDSNNL